MNNRSEENDNLTDPIPDQDKVSRKKKIKYDLILIAAFLLVSFAALAFSLIGRSEGATVTVEQNGEKVAEYPLDADGVYPLNGGTNLLVIEGGEVYMSEANCPDHTCIKTGRISFAGERIVCLPNRIAIIIEGEGGVDAVS
jgi:hypothetical protein